VCSVYLFIYLTGSVFRLDRKITVVIHWNEERWLKCSLYVPDTYGGEWARAVARRSGGRLAASTGWLPTAPWRRWCAPLAVQLLVGIGQPSAREMRKRWLEKVGRGPVEPCICFCCWAGDINFGYKFTSNFIFQNFLKSKFDKNSTIIKKIIETSFSHQHSGRR
jgi:hypothetical protein